MIFGVSLKKFQKIRDDKIEKLSIFDRWQFGRTKKRKFKYNDISDLPFGRFVDCENYLENEDFNNFSLIFVNKYFWQTVYIHELEDIIAEYARQKVELMEQNDFIFNAPQYGEPTKETIGSELRKEFVERFGNYVVLMDVVMGWDKTGYKSIEKWKVSEFFFWANYLTGQKLIEKIK